MWRINHLYKIRTKSGKTTQFKLNRMQEHFMKNKHNFNIILKSRQLGMTTFQSIDMFDDALFNKNFDAVQIAHTKEDAIKIFVSKIQFAWENFPLKELYDVKTDKKNELRFDFGDGTYSSIQVTNSGRSGTLSRVHISELAKLAKKYPEKAREVINGTTPALVPGGRFDIESTAEGENSIFYDMYWDAKKNNKPLPTEYKAHFYNWTWDDEGLNQLSDEVIHKTMRRLDKKFKDIQRKHNLSAREITYYYSKWLALSRNWDDLKQEYPITDEEAFAFSGHKHFPSENLKQETTEPKRLGDWRIYEDFKTNGAYVIGADVAEGLGRDSSTAVVLKQKKETFKVVATYSNNLITPDMFAYELKRIGLLYGSALICPERNNHGHTTISKLKEIYPNIYKAVDERKNFEVRKTGVKIKKYGWLTTSVTKPIMLHELRDAISNDLIEIPSEELLHELRTYDRENLDITKYDDSVTRHWDLVMALAIAYQMRKHIEFSMGIQQEKTVEVLLPPVLDYS